MLRRPRLRQLRGQEIQIDASWSNIRAIEWNLVDNIASLMFFASSPSARIPLQVDVPNVLGIRTDGLSQPIPMSLNMRHFTYPQSSDKNIGLQFREEDHVNALYIDAERKLMLWI